jgi:hypothetical protein
MLPSGRLTVPSLPTPWAPIGMAPSAVSGFQNDVQPLVQAIFPPASTSEL